MPNFVIFCDLHDQPQRGGEEQLRYSLPSLLSDFLGVGGQVQSVKGAIPSRQQGVIEW